MFNSSRRLYQRKEDEFLFKFLLLTSFFLIASLQVKKKRLLIYSFPFFSCCMRIHVVWKLGRNQKLNWSILHCIDIYEDCVYWKERTKGIKVQEISRSVYIQYIIYTIYREYNFKKPLETNTKMSARYRIKNTGYRIQD